MNSKVECFVAILDNYTFIIPSNLEDVFEGTPYYDRSRVFSNYILPDGAIFANILVEEDNMRSLIDGDYC